MNATETTTYTATLRIDSLTRRKWLEFNERPDQAMIDALKAHKWRWSGYRKEWHNNMRGAVVPAGVIVTDGGTCEYAAERPDRLAAAAERHAGEANQLWERSDKMAEAIPLGQPILVGHYSEHRDRNYRKRIQNMTIKSIEESRTAQDLADKARSSAYAQKKRMDPGVIARRIQKLQADVVSTTNHLTHVIQFEGWYLVKGTEEQKAASLKKINDTKAWSAAKIAELEADIAREQATLASVGGLPFDSLDLHVGDFFAAWPGLCEITRINKKTVSVHAHNRYNERRTLDITKINLGHIIARASEGLTMEEIHTRYGAYTMNTTYRHRTAETPTPEEAEQARREAQVKLQQEIAAREEQVMREKGNGYFPTPPDLAAHLVELADIQPGQRVLEPSAGKGDIADAIRRAHPDALLDVVELHPMLCDILRLKGYEPTQCDFLRFAYIRSYDRIIMNPPFEHGQDIEHIRRAYALLAEGGTLVAIASPAFEYRSDSKYLDFAEWLGVVDAEVSPLPDNSFATSDRPTGVATRLIILHK